jgi:uncharacterized protein YyaL (SSP411 family)
MHKRFLALVLAIALFASCGNPKNDSMDNEHKFTNDLIHETSPYLLQHAHNPVDWHAWNEETLELAKKEDKLLLISVGYAACHWCHVMERESFEDSAVAAVMNEHFINVKVDREERPDVDQIYMNAVQLLTGRGGWPLNCVALPDGRPIWGGTYFPKENWLNALNQLSDLYANDPDKAREYAEKLTEGVQQSGLIALNEKPADFSIDELELSINNWKSNMDFKNGGRLGAPKFPMPVNIEFLLRYGVQHKDKEVLDYVETTLTQMAYGGIFDQIGGGFARYSVDDHWHIPHFEKMLYDNAQLVSLYSWLFRQQGTHFTRKLSRRQLSLWNASYTTAKADSILRLTRTATMQKESLRKAHFTFGPKRSCRLTLEMILRFLRNTTTSTVTENGRMTYTTSFDRFPTRR